MFDNLSFGISIHAPREGGDAGDIATVDIAVISIHAPREGGDWPDSRHNPVRSISIHAPREGGDPCGLSLSV